MRRKEKPLRLWRVSRPEQGPGLFVWFDPEVERLTLSDLTEAEISANLDSVDSVSGTFEFEHAERSDGCEAGSKWSQLPLWFGNDSLREG